MSRCPKADALLAQIRIWLFRIVDRDQTRDIDQHRRRCRLTCERMIGHDMILWSRLGTMYLRAVYPCDNTSVKR